MTRYVKQPGENDCEPIGLMNAVKWSGGRSTLKRDRKRLIRATRCYIPRGRWVRDGGTLDRDFERVLRREARGRFDVKLRFRVGIRALEKHLREENGAVFVSYCWASRRTDERNIHLVLFTNVSDSGKTFTVVNDLENDRDETRTIMRKRRSTVIRNLRIKKDERGDLICPRAWFLTK